MDTEKEDPVYTLAFHNVLKGLATVLGVVLVGLVAVIADVLEHLLDSAQTSLNDFWISLAPPPEHKEAVASPSTQHSQIENHPLPRNTSSNPSQPSGIWNNLEWASGRCASGHEHQINIWTVWRCLECASIP